MLIDQRPIVFDAHEQLRTVFGTRGQLEQLVDVGLAIAHAHDLCAAAVRRDPGSGGIALEPLVAFLLLDRRAVAPALLAEVCGIARPALHVEQTERRALRLEGERNSNPCGPSTRLQIGPRPAVAGCVV